MNILGAGTFVNTLIIFAGVVVGLILLRFVLRLTTKLFACGCISLISLGAISWLIVQQL